MQISANLANNKFVIDALQRQWLLDHSQDLEALWAEMEQADFADEQIPYWTELWPASLALAAWLWRKRETIAAKPCLDLGCGMGFTAMVGQYLGARVLACDCALKALLAARSNCQLNGVASPQFVAMDWRRSAIAPHSLELVWAGDILYEERAMQPVLQLLAEVLTANGVAWLAEPGRSIFQRFHSLAAEANWQMQRVFELSVPAIQPTEQLVDVDIWQLRRPKWET